MPISTLSQKRGFGKLYGYHTFEVSGKVLQKISIRYSVKIFQYQADNCVGLPLLLFTSEGRCSWIILNNKLELWKNFWNKLMSLRKCLKNVTKNDSLKIEFLKVTFFIRNHFTWSTVV